MARAGLSTLWTKVTPAISCMISGTSLGLVMAVMILAFMCSMSLLPITSQADLMASVEAVLTCFLVSHMQAVTSGTISGRAMPSCLGAVLEKPAMHLRARTRSCHFFSTGRVAKRAGRRDLIANGLIFSQIAVAVSSAAFLTSGFLELAWERQAPKHSLVNASASGTSARALAAAIPARDSASSLEAHLATRPAMLEARPDLFTPSALTASAMEAPSSRDKFSSLDSIDMMGLAARLLLIIWE
mmetsp:Transcript_10425/g.22097  ORF Transcript_10425/g.22097 Transcript_10425/m.22097 type:complete len:243 (-) Transcript_10425:44-772(-)